MTGNEVQIAFEILLEEIEAAGNAVIRHGSQALVQKRFDEAKQAIELGVRIEEFRNRVKAMQSEWINLFSVRLPSAKSMRRKPSKRLQRGLRTPEDAFRQPILEALVELGGSGTVEQVLETVGKKMEGILNEHDQMPLPSDPSSIRWKNTAQWCRNTMAREGLLKADSPRGIWEISDKGRREVEMRLPQT